MISSRRISSGRAAEIPPNLRSVASGCAFRLWDGTRVVLGSGAPVCTAVVHRPETFVRLIRDPTPLNFAEAYVEGAIDIEGDLFVAMSIANSMEEIRVSLGDRLRILLALWRG
jgi:cyclopropane-fatty-acyl-phospholipid synthase